MINSKQISKKISKYSTTQLSKKTQFIMRSGGKVKAIDFIVSFMVMIQLETNSLKAWAESFCMLTQKLISPNGIKKKLQFRQIAFFEELLKEIIADQIIEKNSKPLKTKLLSAFNRVLIEDSICVKLPRNLADFFKGSFSKIGKAATARIQLRINLKTSKTLRLELQSYRDTDAKFSKDILIDLQARDLVIRDLGYWSLKVFAQIIKAKAFF